MSLLSSQPHSRLLAVDELDAWRRLAMWAGSATKQDMSRAIDRLSFIEPQLLTLVDHPPQGPEWIHEVRHDGYRTLLILDRGQARARL